jgi:hypothetical protein
MFAVGKGIDLELCHDHSDQAGECERGPHDYATANSTMSEYSQDQLGDLRMRWLLTPLYLRRRAECSRA